MSNQTKTELWGTFSVRDHLQKRPFVAEVLLYDRLMIPRPPTPEESPESDGEPEIKRWGRNGWAPKRLRNLLDILGEKELAVELPWDKQARQDWYDLYHESKSGQIGINRSMLVESTMEEIRHSKRLDPNQAPYLATGGLIAFYIAREAQNDTAARLIALAKTPGVDIEPVIAYSSYKNFKAEQALQRVEQPTNPQAAVEGIRPYAMFGWDFFVPEDSEKNDYQLLKRAVKLASRADFRETRQAFHSWLRQMHEGKVEPETARVQMNKMLKEYRTIVRRSRLKTVTRHAAKFTKVLAPLAGLVWEPPIGPIVGVGAGTAELMVEWLLPEKEIDNRVRPAALVYDARRFFGKK